MEFNLVKIKFANKKIEYETLSGSEFLEIFRKNPNLPLKFGCTRGECGTCAIKVLQGMENLSKISESEIAVLRKKGHCNKYRLACQCVVNGFLEIE